MVPFTYVVYTLLAGLNAATDKQPESAKGLIVAARYLTAISWLTYPGVYMPGYVSQEMAVRYLAATMRPFADSGCLSVAAFSPARRVYTTYVNGTMEAAHQPKRP